MKKLLRSIVVAILGWQVRRLQNKNGDFKTIGVVGSYGKTSTKMAIAELLESELHVRYQKGNYNDHVTVPLIFFGHSLPSLFNPLAWLWIFIKNERELAAEVFPCDVVVVELGIDGPGQMEKFGKFLKLDSVIVTSLGPEHMEFFKDVEHVAKEELAAADFSNKVYINENLCEKSLVGSNDKYVFYRSEYAQKLPLDNWQLIIGDHKPIRVEQTVLSKARLYTLSNAIVMGREMGLSQERINETLPNLTAVPGRMNTLDGIKNSIIIDDTYNASPEATILALETLYSYPAKQRIALLGNMNELGDSSEDLHRDVGHACQSGKLDLVVTLGEDANKYLADQAEKAGCRVERTDSPYQAAKIIEENLREDSVILAKGSQNGVFAEEAVKLLLADNNDERYLVRQTPRWIEKKQAMFGDAPHLDDKL